MRTIEQIIEAVKISNGQILELTEMGLSEIPKEVFELKNLKVLRLRKNNISHIQNEISQLTNLQELNLIENQLVEFPMAVLNLPNLETLHLRKNQIKSLPAEIGKLKGIQHLNVGNNELTELPNEIGELSNLKTLFFKSNKVQVIPNTIKDLDNLKEIHFTQNPIIHPPQDVLAGGIMRIILFFILEASDEYNSNEYVFKVSKEFRTAIKQYIGFFPDYVEISKGKSIQFETKSIDEGIAIEISKNDNIEEVNKYFNEYLGFVKTNLESLSPEIETDITPPRKELLILELKQQIHHLKSQVELKNFKVKFLENQVTDFVDILKLEKAAPNQILINTSSQSLSSSTSENNIEITNNLNVEIPVFQDEFFNFKASLPDNLPQAFLHEVNSIDSELLHQQKVDSPEGVDKVPFSRFKRLYDQIVKPDSELNNVVKNTKSIKDTLQNLGKSYNKIAQWTAMPTIPDLFLNL